MCGLFAHLHYIKFEHKKQEISINQVFTASQRSCLTFAKKDINLKELS